jgi:hypothetical protein
LAPAKRLLLGRSAAGRFSLFSFDIVLQAPEPIRVPDRAADQALQNRIKIPLAGYKQKNHNVMTSREIVLHGHRWCAGLMLAWLRQLYQGEALRNGTFQRVPGHRGSTAGLRECHHTWEDSDE